MNEYREPAAVVMHLDPNAAREERKLEREHELELARVGAEKTKARWSAFETVFPYLFGALVAGGGIAIAVAFGLYESGRDTGRQLGRIECLEGKR